MADLDPTSPAPIERMLPSSLPLGGSALSVNQPPSSLLARPASAARLNLLPTVLVPAVAGPFILLAPANPARVSLIIRVTNGAISISGNPIVPIATNMPALPLQPGEDITLEVTGEIWCTSFIGAGAIVYVAETVASISQP